VVHPLIAARPPSDRLRAAAFALFVEQGYEATTVDQIAERAGVGRTTYFRLFASKEAVVFPDHDSVLAQVRARLLSSTEENRLVAVSEAARIVLRHYLDEGELARVRYGLTRTVPALRQREIASMLQYQRQFREFIRLWTAEEPGQDLRAELLAASIITAHNHVLRRWLRGLTAEPLAEFDDAMAEVSRHLVDPTRERERAYETSIIVLRTPASVEAVLPALRRALEDPTT
jgi:AcrR family transcriptional regulator